MWRINGKMVPNLGPNRSPDCRLLPAGDSSALYQPARIDTHFMGRSGPVMSQFVTINSAAAVYWVAPAAG